MHKHASTHTTDGSPFTGPVSTEEENRAAHGGTRHVQTCSCGALRLMNRNGRHVEIGEWSSNRLAAPRP